MGRRKGRLHLPVRLARLEPLHRLRHPVDLETQGTGRRRRPKGSSPKVGELVNC